MYTYILITDVRTSFSCQGVLPHVVMTNMRAKCAGPACLFQLLKHMSEMQLAPSGR